MSRLVVAGLSTRVALDATATRRFGARSAGSRDTYSPSAPPPSSVASDDGACVFERDDVARLPNGARMRFVSKPDVQFLYDEIFADECYAKHGLEIRPGATVIDVGGNIGMFALYAAEKAGAEGRVFALEPIPRTFAALRENVIRNVGFSSGRNLDATVDARGGEKEATSPSGTRRVACLDAKDAALALRRDEFQNHVGDSTRSRRGVQRGVSDGEKKRRRYVLPYAAGWSSLARTAAEQAVRIRRAATLFRRAPRRSTTSRRLRGDRGFCHGDIGAKLLAFANGQPGGASRTRRSVRVSAAYLFGWSVHGELARLAFRSPSPR